MIKLNDDHTTVLKASKVSLISHYSNELGLPYLELIIESSKIYLSYFNDPDKLTEDYNMLVEATTDD